MDTEAFILLKALNSSGLQVAMALLWKPSQTCHLLNKIKNYFSPPYGVYAGLNACCVNVGSFCPKKL